MTDRTVNERLREAFAGSLRLADRGQHCPPSERLWDAANGKLGRRAASDLLLHCGECGVCAEGWRLARLDVRESATDDVVAPGRFRRLAAIAALILVAVLAALLIPELDRSPPVFRDAGVPAVESATDERLPRDACLLRWTSGPEGSRYDVRVMTERLDTLHVAWNLEQPSVTVPAGSLVSVASGTTILWQVTVRLPEGDTEVSETFATVVE